MELSCPYPGVVVPKAIEPLLSVFSVPSCSQPDQASYALELKGMVTDVPDSFLTVTSSSHEPS